MFEKCGSSAKSKFQSSLSGLSLQLSLLCVTPQQKKVSRLAKHKNHTKRLDYKERNEIVIKMKSKRSKKKLFC